MRARYIHEELGFERTGDVKKGLGLGKRKKIHKWFSEWAPYADYEIRDDLSVYVKGYLDLEGSQVTQLPDDLNIIGSLNLMGSQVTQLPEDLSVEYDVWLSDSRIVSLPKGLSIGEDLLLKGSRVTQLPKDLSIGGDIYIDEDQDIDVPKNLKRKIRYV
jgi:hypothetical protein